MRLSILSLVTSAFVLVACSSSTDSGTPPPTTPATDAGTSPPPASTADAQPQPIPVTISGHGRVSTRDGSVDCRSDGTTQSGACNALAGDTLYAWHEVDSVFVRWEPSMSEDPALNLEIIGAPAAVTATFRATSTHGATDAGHD